MANILFVHPATTMSIGDVGRGYRSALERMGHNIRDYRLNARLQYHTRAIPAEQLAKNPMEASRAASETILNEAIYHGADLVMVVSGLNLHPIALWLLGKVGFPVAVVFTESPYDDEQQEIWADTCKEFDSPIHLHIATNDRYSSMKYGWQLLAPSFDPSIHRPVPANPDMVCDVLMVGSGWPERQAILEAVNWDGINLRLFGIWPGVYDNPNSPLHKFFSPLVVNNSYIAEMYCSAKININFHRGSSHAISPNPRAIEIAACGAFQLSDYRLDLNGLFGASVPVFTNAADLEQQIRHYLADAESRLTLASISRTRVQGETFDNRAAALMSALNIDSPDNSPEMASASPQGA